MGSLLGNFFIRKPESCPPFVWLSPRTTAEPATLRTGGPTTTLGLPVLEETWLETLAPDLPWGFVSCRGSCPQA